MTARGRALRDHPGARIAAPGRRVPIHGLAKGNAVRGVIIPVSVLAMALGLGLFGCATPYQPEGSMGGYRELPLLDHDTFLVSFVWTRFTPRDRIQDFLLLRAAEVALAHGAPYFRVREQEEKLRAMTLRGPGPVARRTIPPSPSDRAASAEAVEGMMLEDPREMDLVIQLLPAQPASGSPAIDAAKLRAELRAKYGLAE